ncbi:LamG domain-containing protein, partial [Nanoarchaeota archaeon]
IVNAVVEFVVCANSAGNGSVWHNFTSWGREAYTSISGTYAEYEFNLSGFDTEKTIVWACEACDDTGQCDLSENRTLTIDLTAPNIEFVDPTPANNIRNTTFYNWAYVNVSTSDENGNYSSFIDWNRSLVGWWRLENETSGNFSDSSSYGNDITEIQEVTELWTGKRGKAQRFDDSRIRAPISTSLYSVNTSGSISAWAKPKDCGETLCMVADIRGTSAGGAYLAYIPGTTQFRLTYGNGTSITPMFSDVVSDEWYHIGGTWGPSGGKLYLNGVENDSSTLIPDISASYAYFTIGSQASGIRSFNGTIDEVKLWNRVLSEQEMKADYENALEDLYTIFTGLPSGMVNYTAYLSDMAGNLNRTEYRNYSVNHLPVIPNVTVNETGGTGTNANLTANYTWSDADGDDVKNITNWLLDSVSIAVLNMPFESNTQLNMSSWTKDYSNFSNHGTVTGAEWNGDAGYDGFGAYEFDGTNDYITVANNDSYNFNDSDNFSISLWMNLSNDPGYVLHKRQGVAGNYQLELRSDGNLWWQITNVSASYDRLVATGDYRDAWHHIVMTYTSDNMSIYIDGEMNATVDPSVTNFSTSGDLYIGSSANLAEKVSGVIDDIVIWNRSLTPEMIQVLYENKTDLLVSNETGKNEEWNFCVTPNDGLEDGLEVCGNATEIQNTPPPQPDAVWISPSTPDTTDNLTCYVSGPTEDEDGDPITYYFEWWVNMVWSSTTGPTSDTQDTLLFSFTDKGDNWECVVIPYDGEENGTGLSDNVDIENAPPVLASLKLNATNNTNRTRTNLTAYPSGISDPDGDAVKIHYDWQKSGSSSIAVLDLMMSQDAATTDGQTVNDASTYENDAVLGNSTLGDNKEPAFAEIQGVDGFGVYDFDGDNDYMQVSQHSSLDITGSFSIETWMTTTEHPASDTPLVDKGYDAAGGYYLMQTPVGGDMARFGFKSSSSFYYVDSNVTISDATWHQVIGTYDGEDLKVYIDGELAGVNNIGSVAVGTNGDDLTLGIKQDKVSTPYDGLLGDTRIYVRAVSPEQAAENYNEYTDQLRYNRTIENETLKGDVWEVEGVPIDDDGMAGLPVLGNDLEIENTPPEPPALLLPEDDNNTIDTRFPSFSWGAPHDDDVMDTFTYTRTITGGCGGAIEESAIPGETDQVDVELKTNDECAEWYYWVVTASDGDDNSSNSTEWRFQVFPILYLDLVGAIEVDFGEASPGETNDTTNNEPLPFIVQNDGTVSADIVNMSAADSLFDAVSLGTENFQIMVSDTSEPGSFNTTGSPNSWINVSNFNQTLIADLNYSNATDSARIDLKVIVPVNEPSGPKSSMLWFYAKQT